MDLIKREDAIQELGEYLMMDAQMEYSGTASEDIEDWKDLAEHILKDIPSAEPKQGEWERIPYSMTAYGRRCSLCHFKVGNPTNFCPNCGARMKGADDEGVR